ncbi:MAG TPA: antitoxin [Thermoanaerobaculia bacterium]|nr:antitoxin [Thermoanaerobaculia bacterium]
MNEKLLVLERSVQSDLEAIGKLYEALGAPELEEAESQDVLIVAAYRLHSLYTAFENIFRNIAAAFENHLDPETWHRDLLQRMRLDLTPVRPAIIDAEAFEKLDEMRRFRHVFRTMYGLNLDPLRLQVVLRRALELKPLYRVQIERFLQFLRGLE